ncbi:MAG: beta-galactosidase [Planctomycetaceae bacterium]|nr:beta-galactosidase [Planctomycetaceae bacterium]
MTLRYPPINARYPHFLHGGDYNPDQWAATPQVWDQDMRLMKLAGCNAMSTGIFSWASLEPREGQFELGWLDTIMDKLAGAGGFAVLATPSGSKPAWMSRKYPEICRMGADGRREMHGGRHNHCRTSPVFRTKCVTINTRLAERYKDHPALIAWHVSNEYNGGECFCEHCLAAWRTWLKARYNDSLDAVNAAWWSTFWSHRFSEWEEIYPADFSLHGMMLDWKRFTSDQMIDFYRCESAPLKAITPCVPVTTNFMGVYPGLDLWKFAQAVDVVAWDSYPAYHDREGDWREAVSVSFVSDLNRCLKGGRPYMQMECSPSVQNWKPVNKLKRPGVHMLECMQYVSHGSDTIQYFQWRKSRGGCEKFHGAVVDHCGHENNRVFNEVAQVGATLKKLDGVIGTTKPAQAAILYDWENGWAIDQIAGPRNQRKDYFPTCVEHYRPLWQAGVSADIVSEDSDFSPYKLLLAPMLYMIRPGVAEKLEAFVAAGGTLVTTYLTGIANESDLCFLTGFPGPLRKLLGVWAEEIDVLYDDEANSVLAKKNNPAGLSGTYKAGVFCDLIHAEGAKVLATYGREFYKGSPAVTVNSVGKGKAYYVASRNDERFHDDLIGGLIKTLKLPRAIKGKLPEGVTAQVRTDGEKEYLFLLNFKRTAQRVNLGPAKHTDVLTGKKAQGMLTLKGYGTAVLAR